MKITSQLKARGVKPKKPAKRLPRQALPVSLERAYAKFLWPIVKKYYAAFAVVLKELEGTLPGDLAAERAARTDAKSTLPPDFKKQLEAAARKVARSLDRKRIDQFLERHAKATDRWNAQEFSKQAKAAIGVDVLTSNPQLQKQVKAFTKTNVDLITDIGRSAKTRVERIVIDSIQKGRAYDALADRVQDALDIDSRRATLIARDQTGKLYGEINAERQQDAGVTKFYWRTSNDNRVRDEHEELEKESLASGGFSYADPPAEGLPGEPIQCRCYAEPIFDMLAGL